MKINDIIRNRYVVYSLFAAGGLLLGWLIFHSHAATKVSSTTTVKQTDSQAETEIWTCSMHPQIRMHEPGKCPICGMDLIPLSQGGGHTDPAEIHMTSEAARLAEVQTTVIGLQKATRELRLYGKIQADERRLQSQIAQVPGRIERLMVNYTGERVQKGQPLAVIYSPELVTAQQELIEAAKTKEAQTEIYQAARERLLLWKLTEEQIADIESSETVRTDFEVLSTTTGVVTARNINTGDYVNRGTVLFNIADLSVLWVMFDAYESDIQFIHTGDRIDFTLQAYPGTTFSGKIAFVDPFIDPVTRVAQVRVETGNSSGRLKPEMFATGIISTVAGEYGDAIVVPETAVLWTGKRSVVYVRQQQYDEPVFRMREVELGPHLGDSYVVAAGLAAGEEVVTNGAFSVDAAAQLAGKQSMMSIGEQTPAESISSQGNSGGNNTDDAPVMLPAYVFDQYIAMKNAFVTTDAGKVKDEAEKLLRTINSADMKGMTEDARNRWKDITGKLSGQINIIASSSDISAQRAAFVIFNSQFYPLIKSAGLTGRTIYYQYCPMANNGKGAYWLSEQKDIRNPYYGDEMLTCGEVREVISTTP